MQAAAAARAQHKKAGGGSSPQKHWSRVHAEDGGEGGPAGYKRGSHKQHGNPFFAGRSGRSGVIPTDLFQMQVPDGEVTILRGKLVKKSLADPAHSGKDKYKWQEYDVMLTDQKIYFFDVHLEVASDILSLRDVAKDGVSKSDCSAEPAGGKAGGLLSSMSRSLSRRLRRASAPGPESMEGLKNSDHIVHGLTTLRNESSMRQTQQDTTEYPVTDPRFTFEIETKPDSVKQGRVYHLCATESSDRRDEWVRAIAEEVKHTRDVQHREVSWVSRLRKWLRVFVESEAFVTVVGLMIVANFVANCIEAELDLQEAGLANTYGFLDLGFTIAFSVEVLVRLFAFGSRFLVDGWNILDIVIVGVSLFSVWVNLDPSSSGVSRFSALRTIRALRIIRVFRHFQSMHIIVNSLLDSLWPVLNALMVMTLILGLYAIVGVSFYREKSERFRSFSAATFTMFQGKY